VSISLAQYAVTSQVAFVVSFVHNDRAVFCEEEPGVEEATGILCG